MVAWWFLMLEDFVWGMIRVLWTSQQLFFTHAALMRCTRCVDCHPHALISAFLLLLALLLPPPPLLLMPPPPLPLLQFSFLLDDVVVPLNWHCSA
jgi:hypothetical protein